MNDVVVVNTSRESSLQNTGRGSGVVAAVVTVFVLANTTTEIVLLLLPGSNPAYFPFVMVIAGLFVAAVGAAVGGVIWAALRRPTTKRSRWVVLILSSGACGLLYFLYVTRLMSGPTTAFALVGGVLVTVSMTCSVSLLLRPATPRTARVIVALLYALSGFVVLILPWLLAVTWSALHP